MGFFVTLLPYKVTEPIITYENQQNQLLSTKKKMPLQLSGIERGSVVHYWNYFYGSVATEVKEGVC